METKNIENNNTNTNQTISDQKKSKRSRAYKILASIAVVGTVAAVLGTDSSSFGSDTSSKMRLLESNNDASVDDAKAFQSYIQRNNKNYLTKEEHSARLKIFTANLALVKSHDAASTGFKIDINQFADLSPEEYQKMLGFRGEPVEDKFLGNEEDSKAAKDSDTKGRGLQSYADSIDWRQQGVLSAVRSQGSCGGCYTFSSTCAIEAAYKIKYGSLPQLSEQQLLDCTGRYGNTGCGGGLMVNAYKYLQSYKHMKRDSYPYTGQQSTCQYSASSGVTSVASYETIQSGDVDGHMAALQNQPLSIAVAAGSSTFMLYKGGIISGSACGTNLDHAVNMVGYGSENGQDFWIVRNSWGTSWGERGYFRVARSSRDGAGVCGVLKMSSYPIL